jgi:DNA-binding CsgD family transcriptional regulator
MTSTASSEALAFEVALSACDGALSMLPRDERAALIDEIVHRFPGEAAHPDAPELTAMQWRVLRMMADGITAQQTAKILGIGMKTVDTYKAAVRDRLGALNSVHAVHIAHRKGMLS